MRSAWTRGLREHNPPWLRVDITPKKGERRIDINSNVCVLYIYIYIYIYIYSALQFGAPHFCEKRGARRGPASKPQSLAKKRSAISLEHAS